VEVVHVSGYTFPSCLSLFIQYPLSLVPSSITEMESRGEQCICVYIYLYSIMQEYLNILYIIIQVYLNILYSILQGVSKYIM
jgi:hypothetical protein